MPIESLEQSVSLPADARRDTASLWRELRKVQRTVRQLEEEDSADGAIEALFHCVGNLTAGRSQQFVFRKDVVIASIYVSMTPGTSTTTLKLYKDTVEVYSMNMASGTSEFGADLSGLTFLENEGLSVGATTVGTGAANVVVQVRAV